MHPLDNHPLRRLFSGPAARARRSAPWDRTGGNRDTSPIGAGETHVLLDIEGAGCINHVYFATGPAPITYLRDIVLRCYWDGEDSPSVEVPLGDFFCVSHARIREVRSAFVVVNPGSGWSWGLNAYFPMPFASRALITLENRGGSSEAFGYLHHIDYEVHDDPSGDDVWRFHAQWRQERPTFAEGPSTNRPIWDGINLDGAGNYVALEAEGEGRMVGLHLQIENRGGAWYGEGDDMVFIDGDVWPPSIHGTGTEEVFGGGACPNAEYSGPYTGFHHIESVDFSGLVGMYRWFIADPIGFRSSLRWTIEHGHANNYANHYTSVAYWYQREPHCPFPVLPSREELAPPLGELYDETTATLFPRLLPEIVGYLENPHGSGVGERLQFWRLTEPYFRGDFGAALKMLRDRETEEGST